MWCELYNCECDYIDIPCDECQNSEYHIEDTDLDIGTGD